MLIVIVSNICNIYDYILTTTLRHITQITDAFREKSLIVRPNTRRQQPPSLAADLMSLMLGIYIKIRKMSNFSQGPRTHQPGKNPI